MKNLFHYFFAIITVITGITFIYLTIIGRYDRVLVMVGFEAAISCIFAIMLEPRPRFTPAQIKHDDNIKSQGLSTLLLIGLAICIILFASSCTTSGYGCHGRSKYITGYAPDKWERKYSRRN